MEDGCSAREIVDNDVENQPHELIELFRYSDSWFTLRRLALLSLFIVIRFVFPFSLLYVCCHRETRIQDGCSSLYGAFFQGRRQCDAQIVSQAIRGQERVLISQIS